MLPQEGQKLVGDRAHAAFSLHRLDDDGGGPFFGDRLPGRCNVTERDDMHVGEQRLEGAAVVGAVGGGERGEEPAVERAGERHDVGLPRPFARELECALVRFGAGITEERVATE